jgi:hypothetical protein
MKKKSDIVNLESQLEASILGGVSWLDFVYAV